MYKSITTPETYQISDELNHFLVALLLLLIIFLAIGIWLFAKWLTAGPWFKKKYNKLFKKEKTAAEGIELVKGKVVIDSNYVDELENKIKNAETPQELLELQLLKESHEKEKIRLEKEVADKEIAKLDKLQQKEDKNRIKAEMKQKQKEYKEKEKQRKAEVKKAKKEGQ